MNAVESLHMQLRKIVKNRGRFPNDEAAIKILYRALTKIEQKWCAERPWSGNRRWRNLRFFRRSLCGRRGVSLAIK
jgi:transposase-like protein